MAALPAPRVYVWFHRQCLLGVLLYRRSARLRLTNVGQRAIKASYNRCSIKVSVYNINIWDKLKAQHPVEIQPNTQHDFLFKPPLSWNVAGTKPLIPQLQFSSKNEHREDLSTVVCTCSHIVIGQFMRNFSTASVHKADLMVVPIDGALLRTILCRQSMSA